MAKTCGARSLFLTEQTDFTLESQTNVGIHTLLCTEFTYKLTCVYVIVVVVVAELVVTSSDYPWVRLYSQFGIVITCVFQYPNRKWAIMLPIQSTFITMCASGGTLLHTYISNSYWVTLHRYIGTNVRCTIYAAKLPSIRIIASSLIIIKYFNSANKLHYSCLCSECPQCVPWKMDSIIGNGQESCRV